MIELITLKPIGILPLLDEVSNLLNQIFAESSQHLNIAGAGCTQRERQRFFEQDARAPRQEQGLPKGHEGSQTVHRKALCRRGQIQCCGFLGEKSGYLDHGLVGNALLFSILVRQCAFRQKRSRNWHAKEVFAKQAVPAATKCSYADAESNGAALYSVFRVWVFVRFSTFFLMSLSLLSSCIKPNDSKQAKMFVPRNCYEQLTYSGVFEAVSIRKQGFPFRLRHEEFSRRYAVIFKVSEA